MSGGAAITVDFTVRTREVDIAGYLKLSAVADYLQEAAARHTTGMGIGPFQLDGIGLFWVLSRLHIEMERYPRWGEKISVTTWPKGDRQLVASRDFILVGDGNAMVAKATSQWLLLDRRSQRPQKLDVLPGAFVIDEQIPPAITAPPPKIYGLPEFELEIFREPYCSDIDFNAHMNNTRYVDWISDAVEESQPERRVRSLSINYLAGIRHGERTAVRVRNDNPSACRVEGLILPEATPAFRAGVVMV